MKLTFLIAAALLAPAAALANPASPTQPQATPTAVQAPAAPAAAAPAEALVCRKDRSGGSRSAAKKVCLPKAEWDKQRKDAKVDEYRRADNSFR